MLAAYAEWAQAARLALVIGNDTYTEVRKLKNARNDAKAMARELTAAGFKVTLQPDVDRETLFKAVDRFTQGVRKEDEVVFYFSGHGVQMGPAAYLLPTDIRSESERQVARDGLALDQIAADLGKARYALLVIDACRDNPFPRTATKSIGLDRGLQPIDPEGVDILMAAGPGQKALDRLSEQDPDPNGLFTREFIRLMKTPGLPVRDLLYRVREEVAAKAATVSHKQRPSLREDSNAAFTFYASRVPDAPRVQIQETPAPVVVQQRPPVATEPASPARPPSTPPSVFRDCPECPEMVVIPAGSFEMGSPESEDGREENEGPMRYVAIGKAFALGKTEVTVGEFRAFVRATGYRTYAEQSKGCSTWDRGDGKSYGMLPGKNWNDPGFSQGDHHPVVCVEFSDAKAYAAWLKQMTGKDYRLPSEAEWEYAARSGTRTARYWGDNPNEACRYGNVGDQSRGPEGHKRRAIGSVKLHVCSDAYWATAPVGSFTANQFGLHDMLGNVHEWVEDCYFSYRGAASDGRALTGGACGRGILRGGSFESAPGSVRAAYRLWAMQKDDPKNGHGFRLARTLP